MSPNPIRNSLATLIIWALALIPLLFMEQPKFNIGAPSLTVGTDFTDSHTPLWNGGRDDFAN